MNPFLGATRQLVRTTRKRHDARGAAALGLAVIVVLLFIAAALWIMTDLDWTSAPPIGLMGRCDEPARVSAAT